MRPQSVELAAEHAGVPGGMLLRSTLFLPQPVPAGGKRFIGKQIGDFPPRVHRPRAPVDLRLQHPDEGVEHARGQRTPYHQVSLRCIGPALFLGQMSHASSTATVAAPISDHNPPALRIVDRLCSYLKLQSAV